jgi:hypothetical protein
VRAALAMIKRLKMTAPKPCNDARTYYCEYASTYEEPGASESSESAASAPSLASPLPSSWARRAPGWQRAPFVPTPIDDGRYSPGPPITGYAGRTDPVEPYRDAMRNLYVENEMRNRARADYLDDASGACTKITRESRANLVNMLVDITTIEYHSSDTLFLAVNVLDRLFAAEVVPDFKQKAAAIAAFFLAAKYHERATLSLDWFVKYAHGNGPYTPEPVTAAELLALERAMLLALQFNLDVVSPCVYVEMHAESGLGGEKPAEHAFFAQYAIELLYAHSWYLAYAPSVVAAAALDVASEVLGTPAAAEAATAATATAEMAATGRSVATTTADVRTCRSIIKALHRLAHVTHNDATYRKFSHARFRRVARHR